MTNHNFLRIARESEDRWWTYPLVLFLTVCVLMAIAFVGVIVAVVISVIFGAIAGNPDIAIGEFFDNFEFDQLPHLVQGLFEGGVYGLWLLILAILVHKYHRRHFLTFLTANYCISWERVFQGFKVCFVFLIIGSVLTYLLNLVFPFTTYEFTLEIEKWLPYAITLAVASLPAIAVGGFFLGYFTQWLSLFSQNRKIVAASFVISWVILTSTIYHFTEENDLTLRLILSFAIEVTFWIACILKDNCVDLLLGIFFALFVNGLLVSNEYFSDRPGVFKYNYDPYNSPSIAFILFSLIFTIAFYAIAYYLFFVRQSKRQV